MINQEELSLTATTNNMKIKLLLSTLFFLLLLSSCTKPEKSDFGLSKQKEINEITKIEPAKLFQDLYKKRVEQNEFKYIYEYTKFKYNRDELQKNPGLIDTWTGNGKREIVRKDGISKGKYSDFWEDTHANFSTYVYLLDNMSYSCEEGFFINSCTAGMPQSKINITDSIPKDLVITYLGQKLLMNRTCDELKFNMNQLNNDTLIFIMKNDFSILPRRGYNNGSVVACFDRATGFILSMDGYVRPPDGGAGEIETGYATAIYLSNKVDEKEFEYPAKFLVPALSCAEGSNKIIFVINSLINFKGEVKVIPYITESSPHEAINFSTWDIKKGEPMLFMGEVKERKEVQELRAKLGTPIYLDHIILCLGKSFCQRIDCHFAAQDSKCLELSKDEKSCLSNSNCTWRNKYCSYKKVRIK